MKKGLDYIKGGFIYGNPSFPTAQEMLINSACRQFKEDLMRGLGYIPKQEDVNITIEGNKITVSTYRKTQSYEPKMDNPYSTIKSGLLRNLTQMPGEMSIEWLNRVRSAFGIPPLDIDRTDEWRQARAESFKIGQEVFFVALDCGKYKVLNCSIIDMGPYEASIKLHAFVRRSVVDSLDVFPTQIEAETEAEERAVTLKMRG